LPHARRVDLGLWDDPHRNTWVGKLALAIGRAERPVVLVAHSLGCHVVAWWAEYEAAFNAHLRSGESCPVIGALLVAPPDVEERPVDRRLTRFAPLPPSALPFPSIVVASRDDPYLGLAQARGMARRWGSQFVDAGAIGHVNARSGIGEWPLGLSLLRRLAPASVPPMLTGGPMRPSQLRRPKRRCCAGNDARRGTIDHIARAIGGVPGKAGRVGCIPIGGGHGVSVQRCPGAVFGK